MQHQHPTEYLPPLQHLNVPQPAGQVATPTLAPPLAQEHEQNDEFLNPPQDIQPNDGAVEAPPTTNNPPVVEAASTKRSAVVADCRPHQSLAAVEADSPPNDNQALVPEVAPRPPPKTAAKAADFVTVAEPLKCVNNPRPVLDELPLLPLPTLSWPGHYLPKDLHRPSMAPDLSHAKTGTFPRDGDGGEASGQAGHIHHQAVGPDELPPSQEHTPQPLELSQGSGTPELTWIWETEGKKKRGGRKKKGRS